MNLDKSAILQIKSVSTAQNKKPCLRIIIENNACDFVYDNCKDINYGGYAAVSVDGVTVGTASECKTYIDNKTLVYSAEQGFHLV